MSVGKHGGLGKAIARFVRATDHYLFARFVAREAEHAAALPPPLHDFGDGSGPQPVVEIDRAGVPLALREWEECHRHEMDAKVGVREAGAGLAPELARAGREEAAEGVYRILHYIDGGGGPDRAYGEWRELKPKLQTIAVLARGAEGASAPPPKGETTAPAAGLLSAKELAALLRDRGFARATDDAVYAFLGRFCKDHPDCRVDVPNPKKNESHVLYRTAEVWPALTDEYGVRG